MCSRRNQLPTEGPTAYGVFLADCDDVFLDVHSWTMYSGHTLVLNLGWKQSKVTVNSVTSHVLTSSKGWVGWSGHVGAAAGCRWRVLFRVLLLEWRVRFGAGLLVLLQAAAPRVRCTVTTQSCLCFSKRGALGCHPKISFAIWGLWWPISSFFNMRGLMLLNKILGLTAPPIWSHFGWCWTDLCCPRNRQHDWRGRLWNCF